MAKNPTALTAPQVAVLRWIEAGCPEGVYTEGWKHRIAARALERRGLVSIAGRGSTWRATITTSGRAWLAAPPMADVLPSDSEAEALIMQVLEAGGSLMVEAAQGDELKSLERLVRASLHAANRPRGQKLELSGNWYYSRSSERTVRLVPYFEDFVEKHPVPVPDRVGKYHPVVRHYLDSRDWQYVSKEHLSRAARILQAIATEAERRGLTVISPSKAKKNQNKHQSKPVEGHIWLETPHGEYSVEVRETAGKGGRTLNYQERYNAKQARWLWRRQTEFISTGELEITLDGRYTSYKGERFRDSKRGRLEDKLPDLFAALDRYQLHAEWDAEQARVKAEAEQQRKEAAQKAAQKRYYEAARWNYFQSLVDAHEAAERQRQFVAAALQAAAGLDPEERAASEDYLRDMQKMADAKDPLLATVRLVPMIPEPNQEDLRPFL
ncbi:hypothetical protein [Microbacterium binotii]|uniref:hypothetical protein n=1 Tax=Microbacterium binotii TaxID=462710 RepID=UPI001F3D9648|nr:hypothetical protein [Microbacterium binotii]UIN31298.1 hypothetical protein LXM64_03580 [Microbacterium binotii]